MSQRVHMDIRISADEYLKLYSGVANNASGIARDGRRILFPANILQPFVTRTGVQGSFCIEFDDYGKFIAIQRL